MQPGLGRDEALQGVISGYVPEMDSGGDGIRPGRPVKDHAEPGKIQPMNGASQKARGLFQGYGHERMIIPCTAEAFCEKGIAYQPRVIFVICD